MIKFFLSCFFFLITKFSLIEILFEAKKYNINTTFYTFNICLNDYFFTVIIFELLYLIRLLKELDCIVFI